MLFPTVETKAPYAYGVGNTRRTTMLPQVQMKNFRWRLSNFWAVVTENRKGTAGYVQATNYPQGRVVPIDGVGRPSGSIPGTVSMLPHRVTQYRRPAFWNPVQHYKRQEYLVSPPNLPGTAIPFTLFHPVYIPGLQGYPDTLPYNYGWIQGRNQNFREWDLLGKVTARPATGKGTRANSWKPAMKVPQGPGTGAVWQMPRPDYSPKIINPTTR